MNRRLRGFHMNRFVVASAFMIALSYCPGAVQATRYLNSEKPDSQIDTVYDDDVFISGFKIKFDSKVNGDLFSFSYEMVQTDSINGNLNVFANSVQSLGPVAGSFR